jgi:hypothetical protein
MRPRYLILLFVLAGTIGCARARPAATGERVASLDSLRLVVRELVGEPTCEDAVQCRSVAFGAKPCGGPWSYLVYSVASSDSVRLAQAVAAYNSREAGVNRQEGRVSDCRMVTAPALECRDGTCVAAR